jgi:urea transport system permease protein
MQQAYRSIFGAGEVSVPLPQWLNGPVNLSASIQIPLNKIFIIGLATVVTLGVYLLLTRTRVGLRIRAVTQNRAMSAAIGINTRRVDAMTFAFGSGLAGVAGAVFTLIGSTNPGTGQMYIVNAFIVVVFGGVQSILGTILSAFTIAQSQSWLEYFLSGSMAKMTMLAIVIVVLYFRPTGLFSDKIRR